MRYAPLAILTALAATTAPGLEARVVLPSSAVSLLTVPTDQGSQIIEVQGNKGKGGGKNNAGKAPKNKPAQAKGNKAGKPAQGNRTGKSAQGDKPDRTDAKVKRSNADRARVSEATMRIRAPEGRDMTVLLGAAPLALLGSGVILADVPEHRLLTYRNCPPGLAKKDPPCVPPGLAKKGVGYDEWVTYDDVRLDEIYLNQRREHVGSGAVLDIENLLLSSAQIASLYSLRPAPAGEGYALIDGQPVQLTEEDFTSLLWIHDLARDENLPAELSIAPTAALTQTELRQTYNLPMLEPEYNYSVLNGELVTLHDGAFDVLQMIRIARPVY